MNNIKNKKIAIIGGGPGGLTLAKLLQIKGADAKVYERDFNKDVRVQGATLDLHEDSGLKALEKAGLMNAFKANYRPGADKMRIVDQHGTIMLDQHLSETEEVFGDPYFRPEIDRGPLRKILLESLLPETIIWDCHLLSIKASADSWELEFANGKSALADIVIAADGANSKIRPYITSVKPFYSGVTIVEGAVYDSETAIPEMHRLLKGGKIFAFGNERSIIVSSKGDGSLVFYTGCKTDEFWTKNSGIDFRNKEQVSSWFKEEFKGWDKIWLELFEKAEPSSVPRPQYCMPLDQQWATLPNMTMLGDAAHLMPPYAGEGVNMAMQDALELSECLTSEEFPDLQTALAAFEKQMLVRASSVAEMTLEQTASFHSAQALSNMLKMFSLHQ